MININTFLLCAYFCFVSKTSLGNNNWDRFNIINVEDGLPHYTINDIMQDEDGYIWIATDDGLVKYDSYKYKTYKTDSSDKYSIAGQQVLCIYEDSKDQIWLGTNKALCLFNKQTEKVSSFYFHNNIKKFSEKVPITSIYEYNDSILLIGSDGGGIYEFNLNTQTSIQYNSIHNCKETNFYNRISDIKEDDEGNIWVASLNMGLLRFNPTTKKISQCQHCSKHFNEVRSIIPLSKSQILISTYGQGLWEYDSETQENKKLVSPKQDLNEGLNRIYSIKHYPNDKLLYIGTDGGGLITLNLETKKFQQYKQLGYNSISNNVVKSILVDSEKNLWLGHYKGGISICHNKKPFYNIGYNPALGQSLSHSMVSAIIKDNKDNILIGTDGGGLNILDKNKLLKNQYNSNEKTIGQLKSTSILAFYNDQDDNIWVGTYLDGIFQILQSKNEVIPFKKNHELSNKDIRCFYQDRSSNIWIGTNGGGINIYHPKSDTISYILRDENIIENSISSNWVRCIYGDSYGFIWIGTAYGLNKYDPVNNTFTQYYFNADHPNSISNDYIYSVFEDSSNQVWIGTAFGLNKYDRTEDSFVGFYSHDGLPDNIIYNITEDENKNLWISTNKGISNYHLADSSFINYGVSDGLLSESFIDGAICKTDNNNIYMGSTKGLTYFHPNEIKQTICENPLAITDFKIFNKPVKIGEKIDDEVILTKHISETEHITLSSKQNFISLEFTSLNYSNSGKVNYEYKLENFDNNWVKADKQQRKAVYTNLKPGKYIFKVRTTNKPYSQQKALALTITPSFIQSIWFKLLITLFIIVLLSYWHKANTLKIESKSTILEKRLLENQLENEKEQINLIEQKMRYEMEYKNAQLTSSTLLISHKNDIMKDVKAKLIEFASNTNSNEVDQELKSIITSIDQEFKVEEDWSRFEEHFNYIHAHFFNKLKSKYSNLSLTYLKLSAYIKLNLTSKEIASLMNISVRGVEKARSRLRQKLNIPKDEKLSYFINNL